MASANSCLYGDDVSASHPKHACRGEAPVENGLGGRPPRLLIVEDERVVALDLKNILRRLGYTLAGVTASGVEAVELCDSLRPDLVLMDIFLGGEMDGVEAACVIQDRKSVV